MARSLGAWRRAARNRSRPRRHLFAQHARVGIAYHSSRATPLHRFRNYRVAQLATDKTMTGRVVAQVMRKYDPAEWGGTETHVVEVTRRLVERGFAVEVHAPRGPVAP